MPENQVSEAPLSAVEKELYDAWFESLCVHSDNPTPETWQRRLAAGAAYRAVYDWNRAE